MISGIPGTAGRNIQKYIFYPNSVTAGVGWQTFDIPESVTMLYIFLLAGGGGGGSGFAGSPNGGGGGGGGSSSQTSVLIPAAMLPSRLFLSIGHGGATATAGITSRVSVFPDTTANHTLALANPGSGGTSSTSTTGGALGGAGSIATIATMPLAGLGQFQLLVGQDGATGGGAAGGSVTLPITGLVVTGGAGGGGGAGNNGGLITVPAGNFVFPPQPGGTGSTNINVAPQNGSHGVNFVNGLNYFYGGTGGGATATGATGGNTRGFGGNGGYGCGGGGGGGGNTGAGVGPGGRGGDGLAIIYAW
jgi:hypothetical protein